MNRLCSIPTAGEVADDELWVDNPFQLIDRRENLSSYERNRLFLNHDGSAFLDASFPSCADLDADSRGVVIADFDRDGAPDLLVSSAGGGGLRLFANRLPGGNRIRLNLIGRASNRMGIGCRATVECDGRKIVRDLFPANGFMGGGPAELLIGIGPAERVQRLTIRWPSGTVQQFSDLAANAELTIREGVSEVEQGREGNH